MNKRLKTALCILLKAVLTLLLITVPVDLSASNSTVMQTKHPDQSKIILKGIVRDDTDEPLIGATVMVKDSNEGTVTDIDGAFSLAINAANPVIVVSYIGYETQEIDVAGRTFIDVKLAISSSVSIQEVVVTAMGILRKEKSLTYATQQVKSDDLMKVQDVNVANSLEGKIAGIVITPSAGGAGGASKIQLRGTKSIIGSSSPLIVVDGVPMSNETRGQINDATSMTEGNAAEGADPLSMINPDDIESMNVLKGANAAALYGSRAANGVIMITTKKGKAGKMAVSYTGNVTFETPLLLPKIQNTYGAAVDAQGYLGEANGWGGRISDSPLTALSRATDKIPYEREIHLRNKSNDDVADFYRTGITTNNSVAVSGGTEKIQTYVSFANSHALGLVETNRYNRNTFAFRQTYKLWDRITLNASINVPNFGEAEVGSNMDKEIVVAVLDGAIDFTNPDLEDRAYTFSQALQDQLGCDVHGFNASAESTDGKITHHFDHGSDSHGTHCAGIIGATWDGEGVSGVASNVKIVSVQLIDVRPEETKENDS